MHFYARFFQTFATVCLLLTLTSCAAGFKDKINPPTLDPRPSVIRVDGFDDGSKFRAKQSVAVRKGGEYELEEVELMRTHAEFISRLQRANAADYFSIKGPADYVVSGTKVWHKGGIHNISPVWVVVGYFTLIPLILPWGDAAEARVEISVYDQRGKLVENIVEEDRIVYGMWIIGFFQNYDFKRGQQVKVSVLDRAAGRVVQAIEKHSAKKR